MANRGRFHIMPLMIIIAALILLTLGIVGLVVVGRSNDYYCGTEGVSMIKEIVVIVVITHLQKYRLVILLDVKLALLRIITNNCFV